MGILRSLSWFRKGSGNIRTNSLKEFRGNEFVPLHKNRLNMLENIRCRHDVKGAPILYNLNQTGQ